MDQVLTLSGLREHVQGLASFTEEEKLDRLGRMDQLVAAARVFDREEDNGMGMGMLGESSSQSGEGEGGLERLRRYLDSMQLAAEEEEEEEEDVSVNDVADEDDVNHQQSSTGDDGNGAGSSGSGSGDNNGIVTNKLNHNDHQEEKKPKKKIDDRIKLMTLHASKGLEFDCVFVVGLEEKTLPVEGTLCVPVAVATPGQWRADR